MITKIIKLRNFGIFHDFSWSVDVPEFKQFNLIFGWNRSGKTTLSRIFSACEKKAVAFKEYPEKGEFEIKTDNDTNINSSSLENPNLPLKVFNKDFIEENISFDPSNSCNPIVYVSEEDIKNKKKLEDLKANKQKLSKNFESAQKERLGCESVDEKFRIATAQNIKTAIGNLQVRDKYYDYDKGNIKTVLNESGINNFVKLSDEDLQKSIKTFISDVKNLKSEKLAEKSTDLYPDQQSIYHENTKDLNSLIDELNGWIDGAIKKLEKKVRNPLVSVDTPKEPRDFKIAYNNVVGELNAIIKKHNTRVDNHDKEVKLAKEQLEHHLIALASEKQDYPAMKQDLKDSTVAESDAKARLDVNTDEIKLYEQKTSNIGRAVQKINKLLEEFFGRREIQLELDDNKKGYIIKRDGQIANNLSEGEKTAIAFSYFLVKVKERDFNIRKGVIFIDDPVSSFDSNFIYHCFSVIKNHFKCPKQFFISTHNFELFSLMKDWLLSKKKNIELCEFYMIENIIKDKKRHAYLKRLEETLRKFKSEYHFLFARLNDFVSNSSPEYADFYIIGNIARRFLEIFANFKIPNSGDLASKLEQLAGEKISEANRDKVYKLIQEFSHGSDPTSTLQHKDRTESQEAVRVLLNIIEESDRKHFESLQKSIDGKEIK